MLNQQVHEFFSAVNHINNKVRQNSATKYGRNISQYETNM